MSRARYEITGRLETLTPLHVGSGAFGQRATVAGRDGAPPPDVALIVRDADGAPYLPPTTLKGLLRRLAEGPGGLGDTDRVALFGEIKDDGQGRMGALTVRGAPRLDPVPDVRHAPFTGAVADPPDLGPGVFIAARTRVDAETGTARDSNLFFQEMVAPGTLFAFRCLVEARGTDAAALAEERTRTVIALLHRLTEKGGHAVGKGQADGFGRLRLDPGSVRVARRVLDATGAFTPQAADALWDDRDTATAPAGTVAVLELVCDGPFAVIDASRKAERKGVSDEAAPAKPKSAQLQAQRLAERLPLLLGSGLAGALRTRARWLAACDALRKGEDPAAVDGDRTLSGKDGIEDLTPVQRLFGVTGFRGLLAVERLEVTEAEPWDVTSVKLDRFSGAPVDNALFTTATFVGVRLTVALRLDRRGGFPTKADAALFKTLMDDVRDRGIELGHGGNKGFGWFRYAGGRAWRLTTG